MKIPKQGNIKTKEHKITICIVDAWTNPLSRLNFFSFSFCIMYLITPKLISTWTPTLSLLLSCLSVCQACLFLTACVNAFVFWVNTFVFPLTTLKVWMCHIFVVLSFPIILFLKVNFDGNSIYFYFYTLCNRENVNKYIFYIVLHSLLTFRFAKKKKEKRDVKLKERIMLIVMSCAV